MTGSLFVNLDMGGGAGGVGKGTTGGDGSGRGGAKLNSLGGLNMKGGCSSAKELHGGSSHR